MRKVQFALVLAAVAALAGSATAQQIIGIGTNPQGSFTYPVGAAMAKVIQEKAGITARVQPSAGSSTNIPLVNTGELELALITVDDANQSYTGTEEFAGKPNPHIRLLGVMFPLPVDMLVENDSPIKKFADLKGKRIPSDFPGQTTGRKLTAVMLAYGGLTYGDVNAVPMTNLFKGAEALGQGRVDGAVIGVGSAQVQQTDLDLKSRGGVRFLDIEETPALKAAAKKVYPGGYTGILEPAPQLAGILKPTHVYWFSEFAIASDKLSEEAVYKITKVLYDNRAMLAETAAVLKRFDPKEMAEANPVPYHPGAEKFYREVGLWPPKEK